MLNERVYSVLIVSSTESFTKFVTPLIPETRYYPVKTVESAVQARRSVMFRTYDIVMINSPLPDESGLGLALDLSRTGTSSVLFLSPSFQYSEAEAALRGSGAYILKKPLSLPLLETAVSFMTSTSDRISRLEREKVKVEEKMEEIKLVSRAKLILMSDRAMSEDEAQCYILREAMDKCISKKEEAALIINTYRPL